jgi:PAS domain S-box-containing protein
MSIKLPVKGILSLMAKIFRDDFLTRVPARAGSRKLVSRKIVTDKHPVVSQKIGESNPVTDPDSFNAPEARMSHQNSRSKGSPAHAAGVPSETRRPPKDENDIDRIFQYAPDAIIVIDSHGAITRWNRAAEMIFGWPESDVLGKSLQQIIIPDDYRQHHLAGMQPFLEQAKPDALNRILEVPAIRRDQAVIFIELKISAVKFETGNFFISFIRDITSAKKTGARRLAENPAFEQRAVSTTDPAHQSEKKYRQLFDGNPIPLFIFELSSFRFMDVNEAAIREYGYTKEEFLSMTAVDIRPRDERQRFLEFDRSNNRELQNTGLWKHLKKDGSVIFCEVTAYNIIYEDKAARLALAIDVTEKIRAEKSLRESEEKLRKIFDSRMIGICFWSAGGHITEANEFFLEQIGYTRDDLLRGKINWKDITPQEYLHLDEEALKQIRSTGACEPFEKEYIRKDGNRFPVLVGGASLDERSTDSGVSYIMDISDQKKMQKQIVAFNRELEQRVAERTRELLLANKELESFSYSVSHDLRGPLRAIHGYSQVVLEDFESKLDAEGRRLLILIQHNAKRMGQLVDDLLEFSRIGKRDLTLTSTDMTSVVRQVLWELSPGDQGKYRISVDPLGAANADSASVKIVFRNLISNAIKYASKNETPVIEIGVTETEGVRTYYVKDNGAGFDMKYYHKLFGVFQRLHSEEEFEGTGIGLAIAERIVKKHGGRIWAQAKPGEGATFFLTLNDPLQNKNNE